MHPRARTRLRHAGATSIMKAHDAQFKI